MTNTYEPSKLSHLNGILNSIANDSYTYKWFHYFIEHQLSINTISPDPNFEKLKSQWLKIKQYHLTALSLLLITSTTIIIFPNIAYLKLSIIPLVLFLFFLNMKKKSTVIQLSRLFMLNDFTEEQIAQFSLFMLCEHYSNKYHLTSLPIMISKIDAISQKIIILIFFIITFFFRLNFWLIFPAIFTITYIIQQIYSAYLFSKNAKCVI